MIDMTNSDWDALCKDAIADALPDMPYRLSTGETITTANPGALYSNLTLSAAMDPTTPALDNEEAIEWVRSKVEMNAQSATSWAETIEGLGLMPALRDFCLDRITEQEADRLIEQVGAAGAFDAFVEETIEALADECPF